MSQRLYIGGLFHGVTEVELKDRFGEFGSINNVSIKTKQDGNGDIVNTFAYVDIDISNDSLRKCMSLYNNTKWKGRELKLQLAKESFLNKLKKEIEGTQEECPELPEPVTRVDLHQKLRDVKVKGAPGTKVESMKDWVVGKYGRILPVVHLRRKDKKKVVTFDPSKHCHALKLLADNADDCEKHVEELTWQLEDDHHHKLSRSKSLALYNDDEMSKSVPSSRMKFNDGTYRSAKVEKKQRQSPSKSESRVSDDRSQQQHVDSKSLSAVSKKLKLDGSKSLEIEKKQKITRNKSASFNETVGDKLSSNKKMKPIKSNSHIEKKSYASAASEVKLNGNSDCQSRDNVGVVSFIDESETNDLHSSHQQTPLLRVQQHVVYSEFESAVMGEYVGQEPARKVDRYSGNWQSSLDSSDEDIFDLIESGRINELVRHSQRSRSRCDRLQLVESHGQTGLQSVSAVDNNAPLSSKRQTVTAKVDNYDSASSADTDVIIRSHRVMSDVMASVRNQATGSLQQIPDSVLNTDGQHRKAGDRPQFSSSDETVLPAQSLVNDHRTTDRRRKRKRSSGDGSEAAVKIGADYASSQSLEGPCLIVNENISPKGLPENNHRAVCKQKQKPSLADDSQARVKNYVDSADNSSVQEPKSMAQTNVNMADSSNVKIRKTIEDKKFESNVKRVNSLKSKAEFESSQKALIQQALSNIDVGKYRANRIVFDSDSADDDEETVDVTQSMKHELKDKPKLLLFDNDEEDSAADDDDNELRIRHEFSGPEGSKLLELQNRIGSDSRFQLDSRFYESEIVDNSISTPQTSELTETSEQEAALRVLKTVVPCSLRPKHKDAMSFRNTVELRYDPTADEKQENAESETVKRTKKKWNRIEASSTSKMPAVPETKFFEVTPSLKSVFDNTGGPFCLFGSGSEPSEQPPLRHDDDDDDAEDTAELSRCRDNDKSSNETDSSDTESASTCQQNSQQVADCRQQCDSSTRQIRRPTFFLCPTDDCLNDSLKFFNKKSEVSEICDKWRETRLELIKLYRQRHKDSLRRNSDKQRHTRRKR